MALAGLTGGEMFKEFSEIKIGDLAAISRKITELDVRKFVEMTGDDNPLHIDARYAETTPFKDVVVHGMLGASFISTVIGTKLPGNGALWISQNFDFLAPVRIGDELTISCTVLKKNERERLLELDTKIVNQNKQIVLTGVGKVKVLESTTVVEKDNPDNRTPVAIVTGGSGGIGRAISLRLAKDGFKVVVNYNGRIDKANSLMNEINSSGGTAIAVRADISTADGVQKLVDTALSHFGEVSIVINNASHPIAPRALDLMEWDDIQVQMNTQLKSSFLLAKMCAPMMIKRRWGRIINITSQVVDGEPSLHWTAYTISKGSLASLSKCLALELGPSGITVNAISPGMCETSLIGEISAKNQLMIARQTPLRRLAKPKDIAGAVAFLVSDDASHITGQTILVNGGIATK